MGQIKLFHGYSITVDLSNHDTVYLKLMQHCVLTTPQSINQNCYMAVGSVNWHNIHSGKTLWCHPIKLMPSLYDPAIILLRIYISPTQTLAYVHQDTCKRMFTPEFFVMAKTWKQPKCLSTIQRINKLWHICRMEFSHTALKIKELQITQNKMMNPKNVISNTKAGYRKCK